MRRVTLALFILFILLWSGRASVFAMDTGFSTDNMDLDDQQYFLSSINLLLITEEPEKSPITCFDVNDSGEIVLGSQDSMKKLVTVYAPDGTFQYGYAFNCDGNFGVEWDGNNIILYFVRSDTAALFDPNGGNLELKRIRDTIDNNSYWNHSVFAEQKVAGGNQYAMRNEGGLRNLFASSYSQLIKTADDGSVITVYDAGDELAITTVIIIVAACLFVVLAAAIIIMQVIKLKKN